MHDELKAASSELKTLFEKHNIPILDVVVTPTISFALVKADPTPIIVVVHIDEYVTDTDWDQCMDFHIRAINDFHCDRGFIWIPGKKFPTKDQAKSIVVNIKKHSRPTSLRLAILTQKSNMLLKFITETSLFFQKKPGVLKMKFCAHEEEALHHILVEPHSNTAKNVLSTIEHLFDKTMKLTSGHNQTSK